MTAIIPAAGKGKRMGENCPKQLIKLGGKPILAHTLQVFEDCEEIADVILVVSEEIFSFCSQHILPHFPKVSRIVLGGKERQDSVFRGLETVKGVAEIVVIHDGSRPFVTPEQIARSIELCRETQAVVTAVPLKDTLKSVVNGVVKQTPDRSRFWLAQTPQTFSFPLFWRAHQKAREDNFYATDDSALVERLGVEVAVIEGSYQNIKITTPEDLVVAQAILRERRKREDGVAR